MLYFMYLLEKVNLTAVLYCRSRRPEAKCTEQETGISDQHSRHNESFKRIKTLGLQAHSSKYIYTLFTHRIHETRRRKL